MKHSLKFSSFILAVSAIGGSMALGSIEVGGAAAQTMPSRMPMPSRPGRMPSVPPPRNPFQVPTSDPSQPVGEDTADGNNAAPFNHVGLASALAGVSSADADERFAALRRIEAAGTAESVVALARIWEEHNAILTDGRAWISLAYGLAGRASDARATATLIAICNQNANTRLAPAPDGGNANRDTSATDTNTAPDRGLRSALTPATALPFAREIAALALARTQTPSAVEALIAMVRDQTPGREAARLALLAVPPRQWPELGTPTVAVLDLIGALGDLRAIPYVRLAWSASDPSVRAAAMRTAARLADERAAPFARRALKEEQLPGVRAAAGEVLIRLATPDADEELAKLVADPRTTREVLPLVALRPANVHVEMLTALLKTSATAEEARAFAVTLGAIGSRDAAKSLGAAVETGAYPTIALQTLALTQEASRRSTDGAGGTDAFEAELVRLFGIPAVHTLAAVGLVQRRFARHAALSNPSNRLLQRCIETESDAARGICAAFALHDSEGAFEPMLRSRDRRLQRAAAQAFANRGIGNTTAAQIAFVRAQLRTQLPAEVAFALNAGLRRHAPDLFANATLATCVSAGGLESAFCTRPLAASSDTSGIALQSLLDSPDPRTQAEAIRGMRKRTGSAWLGSAARYAQWDPRAQVRSLARSALDGRSLSDSVKRELARHRRLDLRTVTLHGTGEAHAVGASGAGDVAPGAFVLFTTVSTNSAATSTKAVSEVWAGILDNGDELWTMLFDDSGVALVPGLEVSPSQAAPQLAAFPR
jgi:HEAT repeat protein